MKLFLIICLCGMLLLAQEPTPAPVEPTPAPAPVEPAQVVAPAPVAVSDADLLVGTWKITYLEEDGEQAPQFIIDSVTFIFSKEKVVLDGGDRKLDIQYKIDTTTDPKQMDFTITEEPAPILGIYKIDGDKLEMCFEANAGRDIGRPTKFEAPEGSQHLIFKLERKTVVDTPATPETSAPLVDLKWYSSLATAKLENPGKPIFVDVAADWCGPCKRLETATKTVAKVQTALQPFVLVRIMDNEGDNAEAKELKIEAYPTLIFLDKEGKEIERQEGFGGVEPLVRLLDSVAEKIK